MFPYLLFYKQKVDNNLSIYEFTAQKVASYPTKEEYEDYFGYYGKPPAFSHEEIIRQLNEKLNENYDAYKNVSYQIDCQCIGSQADLDNFRMLAEENGYEEVRPGSWEPPAGTNRGDINGI